MQDKPNLNKSHLRTIQIVSWRDPKNPKAGGAEICLTEIFDRLARDRNFKIHWFAPQFETGQNTDDHRGIEIFRKGRGALIHLSAWRFFQGPKNQKADFFIEDYHGLSLGLAFYIKKPVLIFVHEVAGPIWFKMFPGPLSWVGFWLEKLVLKFLKKAHFIAVSNSTRQDLIDHGIASSQISVITEGSDLPAVSSPQKKIYRRNQIVFLGRICKMKRVDLLLQVFAEVRKKIPETRLVLAGHMDPDFETDYQELVARLDLAKSIDLKGFISQNEKAQILKESLLLVSCSIREGFGLIVVEANSQGTPAVTFDVNGYRDIVENGKNGFLVADSDQVLMSQKIIEVLNLDSQSFDTLAETSLQHSKKFSWDIAAAQVAESIDRVRAL